MAAARSSQAARRVSKRDCREAERAGQVWQVLASVHTGGGRGVSFGLEEGVMMRTYLVDWEEGREGG